MAAVAAAVPGARRRAAAARRCGAARCGAASRRTTRRRSRRSSRRWRAWRVPEDFFDAEATAERLAAEALVVDVDGFEGPLDLLLALARSQKVDLRRISILRARRAVSRLRRGGEAAPDRARGRLPGDGGLARLPEVAAAAAARPDARKGRRATSWPRTSPSSCSGSRRCATPRARLMARDQLGRDVFARGEPEAVGARASGSSTPRRWST